MAKQLISVVVRPRFGTDYGYIHFAVGRVVARNLLEKWQIFEAVPRLVELGLLKPQRNSWVARRRFEARINISAGNVELEIQELGL